MPLNDSQQGCSKTCNENNCYCAARSIPGGLARRDTPQFVMFVYEGSVSQILNRSLRRILGSSSTNPNNCPVGFTLFTSDDNTDYTIVKRLAASGYEIEPYRLNASSQWGIDVRNNEWENAVTTMKKRLVLQANVSSDAIIGFRAPNLQPGGDSMFDLLQNYRFQYDSSYRFNNGNKSYLWPFTFKEALDVNVDACVESMNSACPSNSYGIWEFPINLWPSSKGEMCAYIDQCLDITKSNRSEILTYLWDIFDSTYTSNRAPLMVNLQWSSMKEIRVLDALGDFVKRLRQRRGVWIMTISDVMAWMQDPTPLQKLSSFAGWVCEKKKVRKPTVEQRNYIMDFFGLNDTQLVILVCGGLMLLLFLIVMKEKREKEREEEESALLYELNLKTQKTE